MSDEHPELDELRAAIWDRSELSSPIVFRTGTEPPEHVRLLMRTLGVPVEVGVVAGHAVSAQSRELENGFAHQDYRSSRVRAIGRVDAGEDPRLCIECATELDTDTVVHAPRCSLKPPPAAKAEVPADPKGWEKGRDGIRRSTNERTADGMITAGEQQRRHDEYVDGLPMVARCGVDECDWRFDGTAAEGRDQAATHRAESHPSLATGRRGQQLKPGQGIAQVRAGERQTPDITPDIPEPDIAPTGSVEPKEEDTEMDTADGKRAEILALFRRYHDEHGRWPLPGDIKTVDYLPSVDRCKRTIGTWQDIWTMLGAGPVPQGRGAAKYRGTVAAPRSTSSRSGPTKPRAPKAREAPPVPLNGETNLGELLAAFGKAQDDVDSAMERLSELSAQVKAHPSYENLRNWL